MMGEEEALEPRWLLLQVSWKSAAGSAWMQSGGKLVGTTLVALPRTGACILVGIVWRLQVGKEWLHAPKVAGSYSGESLRRRELSAPSNSKGPAVLMRSRGRPFWGKKLGGTRQWMDE